MPGLVEEFLPDFDETFKNPEEFGETREFMFVNKIFTADVVWDKLDAKQRFIVQQNGLFIYDVLLFIPVWYFKQLGGDDPDVHLLVEPKPEEIIYSPKEIGWIISDIVEAGQIYEMALTRLMA
jgi:hypothetical protein